METLTIGHVAKMAGVGVETIRFYERSGLIPEPPRRASGYRSYPAETVSRINFIRTAKELGFALKEIGELLSLRSDPGSSCDDVRVRAEEKITNIVEKIQTLQRMKRVLSKLVASCQKRTPSGECPILEALAQEPK